MTPRLVLLVVALVALLSSSGCSAAIYQATSRAGHATPPQPALSLAREQLDKELGAPVAVTPLPDGGQLATYKYRRQDPKAAEMARTSAEIHWGIGELTRGYGWFLISPLVELVLTPMAIHRAANPPRGEVQFTISPDGLLLGYGQPPSYGPEDAAVEAPQWARSGEAAGPSARSVRTSSASRAASPSGASSDALQSRNGTPSQGDLHM